MWEKTDKFSFIGVMIVQELVLQHITIIYFNLLNLLFSAKIFTILVSFVITFYQLGKCLLILLALRQQQDLHLHQDLKLQGEKNVGHIDIDFLCLFSPITV